MAGVTIKALSVCYCVTIELILIRYDKSCLPVHVEF